MKKIVAASILCLLFVAPACGLGPWACTLGPWGKHYAEFLKIEAGMTEAEVRALLGEPFREYTQESAPSPYYVKSFSYKERPISNKVLIYIKVEPIAYIWIDRRGRVEDVFIGGS